MIREDFERLVEEAIAAIPEKYWEMADNVRFVVEEEPSRDQLEKMKLRPGWTLFGLYEGVPVPERGLGYNLILPDKITIFRRPLEENCRNYDELREQVFETVWHELGHHLGLDEQEIGARTKRRRKRT